MLQKSGGGAVIMDVPFRDSKHCSHLLCHPKFYEDAVQSFLGVCCFPTTQSQSAMVEEDGNKRGTSNDDGFNGDLSQSRLFFLLTSMRCAYITKLASPMEDRRPDSARAPRIHMLGMQIR